MSEKSSSGQANAAPAAAIALSADRYRTDMAHSLRNTEAHGANEGMITAHTLKFFDMAENGARKKNRMSKGFTIS
jgi:hypothetical protein